MSTQLINSDLLVNLSTEEQELLSGGFCRSMRPKYDQCGGDSQGDQCGGFGRGDQSSGYGGDRDNKPDYKIISYRPTYYRPKYFIKA
ncbi:hypothetical protein A0J48_011160 [Sphaerospermopsis aphanizomenoides BCCUSP55]|uniref:hypothetical protein n=1 Tax=Sphaerospermopsis aphanizomenoides TaxID=459663 RepID=UPI001903708D|nr:hypothetical protein [Sphaerospermopsis aphanizomenoides]MBK1988090.1 hypothetical protein [Sphaerospermopsis aphanizomenoides BCCUSP55]